MIFAGLVLQAFTGRSLVSRLVGLVPAPMGRARRLDSPDGPVVRIRPTGRVASLVLESWDPLPSLDSVPVTVRATVRASEGATLELLLSDVVDAAGTVQQTSDRRG